MALDQHSSYLQGPKRAHLGFPGGTVVRNLPANAGDVGSIPGSRRSPGVGNSNPLQYSCLGNPMDRGAWWAAVHWVSNSQTWLGDWGQTQDRPSGEKFKDWSLRLHIPLAPSLSSLFPFTNFSTFPLLSCLQSSPLASDIVSFWTNKLTPVMFDFSSDYGNR